MPTNSTQTHISCQHIWKIFGPTPIDVLNTLQANTQSREEILNTTGHVVAVRDVSFDVRVGETFVVMGLSGSGKSTLLRCLPRLIEPTHGQIIIDGHDVATVGKQQLRELRRHTMSMVFQHFGLFPHRRIIDNVAYGLEIQGMKKAQRYERAQAVLEMVNLHDWSQHYPGQLSGGMQQRVGLARALAVDPKILLFDEPFSALDPLIRREMQDELIDLQQQMHKSMIFITHDFAEAIKLAGAPGGGRIAIMKDGEFVQVGTPEEVVLKPVDSYVAEFTKDVPKSKVLTARAIMQPVQEHMADKAIVLTIKLDDLIPIVAETDLPFPVVDEDDNLIGCIDRTSVMLALSQEDVATASVRSNV